MRRVALGLVFGLMLACSSGGSGQTSLTDGGAGTGGSGGSACSSCAEEGVECGSAKNSCGLTMLCGDCASNESCSAGKCVCNPTTCSGLGATCGAPDDGCGAPLNCGDSCTPPETCGGGATPYTCGCTPTTCSAKGANCGALSDGCGATLNCGSCTGPQSCGGSGKPNVCGCSPASFEGPLNPTQAANDASLGGTAWTKLTSVFAEDGQYAEISAMTSGETSNYLVTSGFGFQLPSTATVTGIKAEYRRWALSGVGIADLGVRLVKGGTLQSMTKTAPGGVWGATETFVSYGGPGDMWGTTWTAPEINAAGFGAALAVQYTSTAGNDWPRVDLARVTVYFDNVCN